jgi:hypothetical protein
MEVLCKQYAKPEAYRPTVAKHNFVGSRTGPPWRIGRNTQ